MDSASLGLTLVLAAIALDIALLWWWRGYLIRKGVDQEYRSHRFSILMQYLPVFTWIKNIRSISKGTFLVITLLLIPYLFTRLWGLEQYPIYFYCDEAQIVLFGEELVNRDLVDHEGNFLPLYFQWDNLRRMPGLTVYIQLVSMLLWGKSIIVTRATTAIFTIFGVVAVALILKQILNLKYWWVSILVIAITPIYFLFSRTGFEQAIMTSFYACFVFFYLLYRYKDVSFLYAAILFGSFTFYSYSNAQLLVISTAMFLFISDFKYHLQNKRAIIIGLAISVLAAWPFFQFMYRYHGGLINNLRAIHSYWLESTSLGGKIFHFGQNYLYGLNPLYWFFRNTHDNPKARMEMYPHFLTEMLPFALIGFYCCVRNIKQPSYRTIILAAFAAPLSASLDEITSYRMLVFVVPVSLLISIGVNWTLVRLRFLTEKQVSVIVIMLLVGLSFWILIRSLKEGGLWDKNYGLYGSQYGTKQIFQDAIPKLLETHPESTLIISSNWANHPKLFIYFFLNSLQQERVKLGEVYDYLREEGKLSPKLIFLMPASTYQQIQEDEKIEKIYVDHIINFPDGKPAFYFARLTLVKNVKDLFEAEKRDRFKLINEQIIFNDIKVQVLHSRLDVGQLTNIFDGHHSTLIRGSDSNPFILEFDFPQPHSFGGLALEIGTIKDLTVVVFLFAKNYAPPEIFTYHFFPSQADPCVELVLGDTRHSVSKLRIEIKDNVAGEYAKIHVRELIFR